MSNDRMTAEEIRRDYREAKNPQKQLLILAECNLCKPADIRAIINGETDELPPPKKAINYSHVTQQDKDEIMKLHRSGLSKSAISARTERGWHTVDKIIKEAEEDKL